MNTNLAIRLQPMAVLWLSYDMPYRPTERSVIDERALLRVLGASRRGASLNTLIARNKRPPPPTASERPAPPDGPHELPTTVPTARHRG